MKALLDGVKEAGLELVGFRTCHHEGDRPWSVHTTSSFRVIGQVPVPYFWLLFHAVHPHSIPVLLLFHAVGLYSILFQVCVSSRPGHVLNDKLPNVNCWKMDHSLPPEYPGDS